VLEKLKQIDIDLFVFLNGLGSVTWDPFWEMVTGFYCWIPFFAVIIYYTFKKLGRQHAFLALSMVMLALFFTDETTTLIKHGVKRLRPCNNPAILHFIRAVQQNNSFSFVSGHSSYGHLHLALAEFTLGCIIPATSLQVTFTDYLPDGWYCNCINY